MNNDLISRSALLDLVDVFSCYNPDCEDIECEFSFINKADVENAPAVDAVEVDKAMAWLEGYTMTDTRQIYSNSIVYVPMFRVEQAFVDKAYNGLQEG